MTETPQHCPQCGTEVPRGAAPGLCPACLLRLGEGETETDGSAPLDPPPDEEAAGGSIGRYRLLEVIGQGGFGAVWMAEQSEPMRRNVALKITKLGMDTREIVARFEAERQALALMDHPNIARVFDGGATGAGRPYFVMELVRGLPLADFCDARQLTTRERLELFIPICQAVQHAHQKGIIHRDLKPSNILVAEQDGRPMPKVLDFGIAKAIETRLTEKTVFTRFNQWLGTPAYMSPEQAGLGGLDIDTRSDIYSLGTLLYELITGGLPFEVRKPADREALLRTIREQEPPRPSTRLNRLSRQELGELAARRREDPQRFRQAIRGELDWIILKALEKDRRRRYASANDLAADLQRLLNDEPVSAAPPTLRYQLGKFATRHRAALGTAVAFVLVLLLGTTVSVWEALRATRFARSESEQLYASDLAMAFQGWELGRAGLVRELLRAHRPAPGERDLRGWEWRYLWGVSRSNELAVFPITNHYGYWSCALSADGQRLAGGTGDGTVVLWDVPAVRQVTYLGSTVGDVIADSVAFAPDGSTLVHSRRGPRDVLAWDVRQGTVLARLTNALPVQRCALSPDGRWVAACGGRTYAENGPGELRLWETATGRLAAEAPPQPTWLVNLRFSPDNRWLVSTGGKGHVKLWSVPELTEIALLAHDAPVHGADFSPNGRRLATGDVQGFLHVWQLDSTTESWNQLWRRQAHVGSCDRVHWSPDDAVLATGGRDQIVRLWDWAAQGERAAFKGHAGRINGLAFSPDGRRLFSASQDKTIRMWDTTRAAQPSDRSFPGGAGPGTTIAFSPDSRWVVRPVPANRLEILDLTSEASPRTIEGARPAFDAAGQWLATVAPSNRVVMWSTATWQVEREFPCADPIASMLAFSPDSTRLAAATTAGGILVWNTASGLAERPGQLDSGPVVGPFFSGDGRSLTIVHQHNGSIESLDCATGRSLGIQHTGSEFILSAARSPDGDAFALGETGPRLRVWLRQGGQVRRLNADAGSMVSVAWSPDGQTIAGGTFEGLIKLWNRRTLREVGTLRAHGSMVTALAFSPDGRSLVSTSVDGTTRLWTAPEFNETDAAP